MAKRKDSVSDDARDKLEIMPLGAGNEVGRSCVYMAYKGKTVLFDCGIHPAYSGIASLPYFDEIDPASVDVLLVTHFHLDHAASLPYFLEKTSFKGRVFMTHATKAVYKLLLSDFVKVSKVSVDNMLFDEQDIARTLDKIEVVDFHQIQEVSGIRFWCYTAGHVLGAAMFMVDIAGVRVLYTGDYSREEDRHLRAAEMPPFSPELCIIESTYGVQLHERREVRERRFTDLVSNTVLGGGRVLIPAFALGRAQELLLILDEFWQAHPELHGIPVYYASPLAKRCMAVYQTYIGSMNDRIRKQYEQANPFQFKHIQSLKSIDQFDDQGPSVVMASPGGLQSGLSRQLFDRWCQDRRSCCIIPGYVVEGTLAKTILSEPAEVTISSGLVVPLRMGVHYISFSAHADFAQTSAFLAELAPSNIVLVHGEATEMGRLKAKLISQLGPQGTSVLTPKNCQTAELFFKGEKVAKAVGRLADVAPLQETSVSGLLVKKGFSYQLLAPEDLPVYTRLATGSIVQRQSIAFSSSFDILRRRLEQVFEGIEETEGLGPPALQVPPGVKVEQETEAKLVMEWVSDPVSDMVADSIVSIVLQFSPKRRSPSPAVVEIDIPSSDLEAENFRLVQSLLTDMFGEAVANEEEGILTLKVDELEAIVRPNECSVECSDESLRSRILLAVQRIRTAMYPLDLRNKDNAAIGKG